MKKQKKVSIIIALLVIILILLTNQKVFANNITDSLQPKEYSKEYEDWLKLSDEEKKKVMQPRMYDLLNTSITPKSPLYRTRMIGASLKKSYSLKDVIPDNVPIRNQLSTGTCWVFVPLSSLETNLAMSDYKKGIETPKEYNFSVRHMEYATSKMFANDVENEKGYNRDVGDGGTWEMAISYLTNGTGAIPEEEMPFEDNEDIIDISEIQNKTVTSQIYDTVEFANYMEQTAEKKTEIINQVKQHIQNYGSVHAGIHSDSNPEHSCYNEKTNAKFCNDTSTHSSDHGVSIIGWDDDYEIDNFVSGARPTSKGAWIVRNSWGEEWGDNGLVYVSYEDDNICRRLRGIVKATDTVEYDNIYQYDEYEAASTLTANNSKVVLCNIFNKKTNGTEYLTQVSINAAETYTCKVYVNPNGTSKAKEDLQPVALEAGETETFNAGYHTLEFAKPVEIKSNSFAVVIEIQGTRTDGIDVLLESRMADSRLESVKVENGKCFLGFENAFEDNEWVDLGKLSEENATLVNGDSTIKAFTTNSLYGEETIEQPEIPNPPADIVEEKAENSNLDNSKCDVKKVQAYFFTNNAKENYLLVDVEINGISRNLNNDKVEYYYYLSSNGNEEEIKNWTKISTTQNSNNKLQFTIDSRNVSNYDEISNENVVYLYVKEVATKGEDQGIVITKAMKLETDKSVETYVDNVKWENAQSNNSGDSNQKEDTQLNNSKDNTIAQGKLPNTGAQIIVIALIVIVSGIGIFLYARYKNLSKYIK